MADGPTLELRLEVYPTTEFSLAFAAGVTALLSTRWPERWDVKIPARPTAERPAEWRATVSLPEGATPETLHRQLEADLDGLDPQHQIRFRTRWAFAQTPNHQEVYEVRWSADRR